MEKGLPPSTPTASRWNTESAKKALRSRPPTGQIVAAPSEGAGSLPPAVAADRERLRTAE